MGETRDTLGHTLDVRPIHARRLRSVSLANLRRAPRTHGDDIELAQKPNSSFQTPVQTTAVMRPMSTWDAHSAGGGRCRE